MNYLHERSIIEGKIIYFYIDGEENEYWAQIKDQEEKLKTYKIPDGIEIKEVDYPADDKRIIFYPDGRIDKVSIGLENRYKQEVVLTTKGVFGGVKLLPQG